MCSGSLEVESSFPSLSTFPGNVFLSEDAQVVYRCKLWECLL